MKRYYVKLQGDYSGSIVIDAKSKEDAEDKANEIFNRTQPYWMDLGGERVEVELFNKKKHQHEYNYSDATCICGEVNQEMKENQ